MWRVLGGKGVKVDLLWWKECSGLVLAVLENGSLIGKLLSKDCM